MQTPYRAKRPGKPSESDRREAEEADVAYLFLCGGQRNEDCEHGEKRTGDGGSKESGPRGTTEWDTS